MKAILVSCGTLVSALGVGAGTTPAQAQGKTITLCWAAWDPANALVELSKDFTAKTGVGMKFEFVPWTNYADRFLNELNSHGSLCDLIIGYSQWPKNTPNYWALPAMGDAVGWTYRKDWFARPDVQKDFKAKYGRDLAVPKTLDELHDIAQFFQGREIDGKKVYGASIYTERGSEGITMGVSNYLYDYGFKYQDPNKPYAMDGFVNSPAAVKGLDAYKELYKCCTPPGASNSYMSEGLDAFKSGQVALQMNFFAFFPGLYKDPNVGGDKIGFFSNPAATTQATQLGGQGISVVSYSKNQNEALQYIKWFSGADVQKKWWALGGYSCAKSVLNDPSFPGSAPFAGEFLKSMGMVVDFWAEPSYAQLLQAEQKRIHDYVVADKGTAKEALDGLVKDWKAIFKEEGKKF
jgi:multiple sugar transport system substrate-binding protein